LFTIYWHLEADLLNTFNSAAVFSEYCNYRVHSDNWSWTCNKYCHQWRL